MLEPTEEDVFEEVLIDGVDTHLIRKRSSESLLSCLRLELLRQNRHEYESVNNRQNSAYEECRELK